VGDNPNAQRVLLRELYQIAIYKIILAVSIGGHEEIPSFLTEGGAAADKMIASFLVDSLIFPKNL
jgi:hypothetical protein